MGMYNLLLTGQQVEINVLPVYVAAILDFRLSLTSDIVRSGTIGMPDPENMVFAGGILFLSGLQAET